MGDWYGYKKETVVCPICKWKGLGSEVRYGEMFGGGCEIHCPKCGELFDELLLFPTHRETLLYGDEEEVNAAQERRKFLRKLKKSQLSNTKQLPDLEGDKLIFKIKEESEGEDEIDGYVMLTYNDEVLWKEVRGYEYYERFMEIGNILKQKYGKRMIDLVPPEHGFFLYGDSISSIETIKEYRETLR